MKLVTHGCTALPFRIDLSTGFCDTIPVGETLVFILETIALYTEYPPRPRVQLSMVKRLLFLTVAWCCAGPAVFAAEPRAAHFHATVQPILKEYCSDCHEDGANKGGIAFDAFKSDGALLASNALWLDVLKNLRAGLMPPQNKPRPTAAELKQLEAWIKYDAFDINPAHPDPGRVTVRRLNRVDYRNTIRDLLGVDYDTEFEFPVDDTGYGFDTIGDVLTLPPMLLEKYLNAAKAIISETVPVNASIMPERTIPGHKFHRVEASTNNEIVQEPGTLSYYETTTLTNHFYLEHAGHYQLAVDLTAHEHFVEEQFDYNKSQLIFKVDGNEIFQARLQPRRRQAVPLRISRRPFHGRTSTRLRDAPLDAG